METYMTRREQLQKLPLQKRLQAIENIRRYKGTSFKLCVNLSFVGIPLFFVYADTRQGHDYWWKINIKYFL